MSVSYLGEIQATAASASGAETISGIPFVCPVGSLVVIAWEQGLSSAAAPTVTDTHGNTWVVRSVLNSGASGNYRHAEIVCLVTTQIETTDTITISCTTSYSTRVYKINAWSGIASVDKQNSGIDDTYPQSTALSSGSVTTTKVDDLAVGSHSAQWATGTTFTATSGFTGLSSVGTGTFHVFQEYIQGLSNGAVISSAPVASADEYWNSWITAFITGTPPQKIRPDADLETTGWSTAPLWSKVSESVADGTVISGVAS